MRTDNELPYFEDYIGVINKDNNNFYFVGSIKECMKKIIKISYSEKLLITSCSSNVGKVWNELHPRKSMYGKQKKEGSKK